MAESSSAPSVSSWRPLEARQVDRKRPLRTELDERAACEGSEAPSLVKVRKIRAALADSISSEVG